MKSLTIKTLAVAMALSLSATTSMAADLSGQPVSQSENHMTSATATTSTAPFHALSGLDAKNLAVQELTDEELKAIEGGRTFFVFDGGIGLYVMVTDPFMIGFYSTCGCATIDR